MTNAVIYARYSSYGQKEQSIEGQLRECHAFAEREGYTVIHEYIDRALSGRSDDRPEFQHMIKDAVKKQFQYVIVWKLDRFSRNRYDSALHKAKLKKYGVRVLSATENITTEPEGIILEGMLESLAEYYSANLSKHVKRGQKENAINGHHLGGHTPFGFKIDDMRLVADEKTAPYVKYIFEQYAKGSSKKEITNYLNARGVKTALGKSFTYNTLTSILKNKKYMGTYTFGDHEVANGCDVLIEPSLFYKARERAAANKRAPAKNKAPERYLLNGKAFCGMCGARLVGESGKSKNGAVHKYYACSNRKKHHTCNKMNEKKGYLEWYVVEQTVEYVLAEERSDFIATKIHEQYKKEFDNSGIQKLEAAIEKANKEIDSAVDASIAAPPKGRQRFFDKIEHLETQLADMQLNLSDLKLTAKSYYTKEQILAWLQLFCQGDLLEEDFQERIISTFINAVYLYDDKIKIFYNIKDCQQVSYIEMLEASEEPVLDGENVSDGSVRISDNSLHQYNSNPNIRYIFYNSMFGIVLYR